MAECSGLYRRQYGPPHGTRLADAQITATTEGEGASPITRNTTHFPMLKRVDAPYAKDR